MTTAASSKTAKKTKQTASPAEIAQFTAIANEWWNPDGKFRPLHRLNPLRITYIRDRIAAHFNRDSRATHPLKGLKLIDIGCGGGLLAEPMTRLGASVTGIDASEKSVRVAEIHARQLGLEIDYRCLSPEDLAHERETFDVVLNMEVVEHVTDLDAFIAASTELIKPNGVTIVATLNRTLKSLALAKFGAEYVLRWLPVGTHDWRKFVRPSELESSLRRNGVELRDLTGIEYNPLTDKWSATRDLAVNYMVFGVKN